MHEELKSGSATQQANRSSVSWRWGFLVTAAIIFIALLPQVLFIIDRGTDWNGANASQHPDEVAYSAYVGSLIHSRSRRNDPFTGASAGSQTSVSESLFSIQFVAAYLVAVPARLLGLSTSTVFIVGMVVCSAASALAIFWLLRLLSNDGRFAAASVCVILCLGTLIATQGIVRHLLNLNFLIPLWLTEMVSPPSLYHLPFLRFYLPAVGFPFFFLLCALVWLALTTVEPRRAIALSLGAGLTFVVLVFSYFYLWTAAAAWLLCLGVMWISFRSADRRRVLVVFGLISLVATPGLFFYFRLLGQRSATVDSAQGLLLTHRPDLFRVSEILVVVALAVLVFGVWRGLILLRDPLVIFTASLALMVLVVFNHQVVTGRSLQATHYEWFIANYCALLTVALTLYLWRRARGYTGFRTRQLAVIAVLSIAWGIGEVWLAQSLSLELNRSVDEFRLVTKRLTELSATDGTAQTNQAGSSPAVVLVEDLKLADRLPADAPQAVIWSPHLLVFPTVTEEENRERFLKQLYYLGYDRAKFNQRLDSGDWNFYAGLFPYYRLSSSVTGNSNRISPEEIGEQISKYLQFTNGFNRQHASTPTLSYLVLAHDSSIDWTNLERWYARDEGERLGKFVLYRLKLKN